MIPNLLLLHFPINYQDQTEFPFFLIQASGSLYGALGGSILAYRVTDFLGELKSYTNLISLLYLFDKGADNFYHLGTGRRIELVTAAALYILGALVTGFAPNFVALIIGRILYGIGIGLVSTAGTICFPKDDPRLLLLNESNLGTHVKMISGDNNLYIHSSWVT